MYVCGCKLMIIAFKLLWIWHNLFMHWWHVRTHSHGHGHILSNARTHAHILKWKKMNIYMIMVSLSWIETILLIETEWIPKILLIRGWNVGHRFIIRPLSINFFPHCFNRQCVFVRLFRHTHYTHALARSHTLIQPTINFCFEIKHSIDVRTIVVEFQRLHLHHYILIRTASVIHGQND